MRWLTKEKTFYKSIFALAVPISMQHLVSFLVTFADNVMVGQLGDAAVSGIYLGGQIQFLLQQLTVGMGSAMLILTAQYWGKQDAAPIRRLLGLVLRIGGAVSLLMALVSSILPRQILSLFSDEPAALEEGVAYLQILAISFFFFTVSQILIFSMRGVENARIGAYASLVTLATNVLLNYLLIFGIGIFPKLGVRGAALATLIARMAECAVVAFYVFRIDRKLKMTLRDIFAPAGKMLRQYIRYGLPVIAGDIVWAINILCQGGIMGHYNEEIMTAVSITNTLNNLIYVWLNGLWGGVSVTIGKTIGEGRKETVKEYARTCQLLFLGVGLISGGLIFSCRGFFIALYHGVSQGAINTALQLTAVLSVTIIGTCYQACCLGALVKAGGDTSFVFKNDSIFVFLVVLPSAMIASYFGMPIRFVFLCLKSDQILKCAVAVVKVNRYRWIKRIS